jgi:ADP-ribose pyrophosphatase YjhB (NUDIX family)
MRVRVAGVLLQQGAILLVKHRKEGKDYWLLPGGGVGLGESTRDALKREFSEELNIHVEIGELLFVVEAIKDRNEHIIQPTFSIRVRDTALLELGVDRRVVDYHFFLHDKIGDLKIYPDIKDELIELLKSGKISRKYVYKKWID